MEEKEQMIEHVGETESENTDPRRNHYVVRIRRDTALMMTFIKFQNRVSHPRVTFNLLVTGILFALVPTIVKGLALPGVIISYGMGALLILMGLFRQYLTLSMMKNSPEIKENEEITYYFGNSGVRALRGVTEENMGYYKNIYRVWEDERTYYVGMNEEDLLILPKDKFETGNEKGFLEFILDKSGAEYRWTPVGLINKWKDFLDKTKKRILHLRMEAQEQEKQNKKK